jgi:heparan-alpha-glucosaminide N-acetyltransferase
MALSFKSLARAGISGPTLYKKIARRTAILFGLGLFLNCDEGDVGSWRIPGVLQYFAFSYLITCVCTIFCADWVQPAIQAIRAESEPLAAPLLKEEGVPGEGGEAKKGDNTWGTVFSIGDRELLCYWPEWALQALLLIINLSIRLGGQAPNCPRGYAGPGGIGSHGDDPDCTGGIHRAIDVWLLGEKHIYQDPTCKLLYNCQSYDPEGIVGSLTACMLTYLGLMSGRILVHITDHSQRLVRWSILSFLLLLLAAGLCGFSQNDGVIPVNKNLWSVSFGFVTAGGGLVGLGLTYVLVDWKNWFSGAPMMYLGMNSILIYTCHDVFSSYFPFHIETDPASHGKQLATNFIGASSWVVVAYWCYTKKFFVKV